MITWTYKGLPKIDWSRDVSEDTYYSLRVLVMARWASGLEPPEPRMAEYIRYSDKRFGEPHWLVDGMTGNVEVIAWTYITIIDINQYHKENDKPNKS
jgi:hypothetical protein